ncbi:MAG: tripartite tricarboxylate transporter permease [Deferribacteres bacterium]|nr:tripartite tricarboxylate transporter permease [candidate division KSB1 bacterium]MCB9504169.1 tripartite tricarboxylate transporter permease [Deferribacteres bacterium]
MEIFAELLNGFQLISHFTPLLIIAAGIVMGILVGVMPGLSPAMGVALLVPFSYGMEPLNALILLASVYAAANYGGTITAIAINTPGTPSAIVSTFDGYPLTKQGQPGRALGTSVVASTVGGLFGTLILIFFSVPLAQAALHFGPAEYFALAVFGLTIISSLSQGNWIKAFIATLIGLFLNTIGMDPFTGYMRFTFDVPELADGFNFIPALIGLFALSEIFLSMEKSQTVQSSLKKVSGKMPNVRELWGLKRNIAQSSIIGTLIGVVPGAGATIAAFIAYNEARRMSKTPELFGKGALDGVAASGAATSGSVGGALVPLLTLGIPGSASTAVLIGALMLHGLTPGPELFKDNAPVVYGLFASLFFGYAIMFIVGYMGNQLWMKIISAPKAVLNPIILAIAFIGSYAVGNSMFDVWSCLGFGILGWILRRYDFPTAPVILGLILGFLAETNFRRALLMGNATIFFTRPISLIMLILALLSLTYPFIKQRFTKRK